MKGLLGECEDDLRQLSVHQRDLPSASVNIPYDREAFCQLPSTFRAAGRTSINFCQLSIPTGDLLSLSVSFPCDRETFCQLPLIFCAAVILSVQILSTFFAAGTPVKFCRLFVWPRYLL